MAGRRMGAPRTRAGLVYTLADRSKFDREYFCENRCASRGDVVTHKITNYGFNYGTARSERRHLLGSMEPLAFCRLARQCRLFYPIRGPVVCYGTAQASSHSGGILV